MTTNTAIKIIELTDQTATIGGYGVVFGGRDLQGDTFSPDTDYRLKYVPDKDVYFDHALTEIKAALGKVVEVKADDKGLWLQAQLDRSKEYVAEVLKLIEEGVLGWSSGSISHLVERIGGTIKTWPIVEFSLTPTPAEPRTLGVELIKSLAAGDPRFEAFLHQDTAEVSENAGDDPAGDDASIKATGAGEPPEPDTHQEENIMDEKTIVQPEVDVQDIVDKAVKAALAQLPIVNDPGTATKTVKPEAPSRDAVKAAFSDYVRKGMAIKAAMQEGTDSEGGYLVPEEMANEVVRPLYDLSILRQAGARIIRMSGTDSFKVPVLTGSGAAVLTGEEAAYNQKEPTVAQITFAPYKYTKLSKVSEELLSDSRFDVWSYILAPDFVQAFAAAENAAFAVGTGSSQPQGVVTGATVGVTAASATAITADEMIDLYHALDFKYRANAVWMMNDSTIKMIRKLKDGDDQYLWQPGLQAGQPDRILGRPVFTNNSMAAAATGNKTVLFGDMSYFWIADWSGLSTQRLNELYAVSGQVGFIGRERVDSHVMLAAAIQVLQQA